MIETNNKFVCAYDGNKNVETITFHNIPFIVHKNNDETVSYETATKNEVQISLNGKISILFFLGMVTNKPESSEWWGQNERYYANHQRVFLGDRIGRINVIYKDKTMETIPLIFGVNIWNYELFSDIKSHEKNLNTYHGPYREPFESSMSAAKILSDSLILMENNAEKKMKYVFGVELKNKELEGVYFVKESYKECLFCISAVTGLMHGSQIESHWKYVSREFFSKQKYIKSLDKLSRRLYQYLDDIPDIIDTDIPNNYYGPIIKFTGNKFASINTNIYYHNIIDMAEHKVDRTGMPHTSSKWAPSYGLYIGFGTYKRNAASYHSHIWSRDVGRILIELTKFGYNNDTKKSAQILHKYLYDKSTKYDIPNWKRIANASELDINALDFASGKENDGHASIMLFIYNLYQSGTIDKSWVIKNLDPFIDAVGWIEWQIRNPEKSNFDKTLYSESEASTQIYGGYDLFSNVLVYYALKAYERIFNEAGIFESESKCRELSEVLKKGIYECFTTEHPIFGTIFIDSLDDCWTYEYKRFALLFICSDIFSYDPISFDSKMYRIASNTYLAQRLDYYSPSSGRQMGYGQGYLTQIAILLDEYDDFSSCMDWVASFCYHHTDNNYIVPEGVIKHPSNRFWFRNGDLGNAVQQGEIIKCMRLIIGLDDLDLSKGLNVIPRIPKNWSCIFVEDYPINCKDDNNHIQMLVSMKYERINKGFRFAFNSQKPLFINSIRVGPFDCDTSNTIFNKDCEIIHTKIRERYFCYIIIRDKIKDLNFEITTNK